MCWVSFYLQLVGTTETWENLVIFWCKALFPEAPSCFTASVNLLQSQLTLNTKLFIYIEIFLPSLSGHIVPKNPFHNSLWLVPVSTVFSLYLWLDGEEDFPPTSMCLSLCPSLCKRQFSLITWPIHHVQQITLFQNLVKNFHFSKLDIPPPINRPAPGWPLHDPNSSSAIVLACCLSNDNWY